MIKKFECFADYYFCDNIYNNLVSNINMANQYTKKEIVSKDKLKELYEVKNMTYLEIANLLGVSVKVIQNRIKCYGIKPRKAAARNRSMEKGAGWNGGITYRNGYKLIKVMNHPRKDARGYVPEHILIMEKLIGRNLKYFSFNNSKNEVVHHLNLDKKDNRIQNLKLMTLGEHISLHCKGKRYKHGKRTN